MDIVYDAVVGAVALKQLRSSEWSPSLQQFIGRLSGGTTPQLIGVKSGDPRVNFESLDITGVMAGIAGGLAVSADTITVPYNKMANGGTFAGSGANAQLNATDGLFVVEQYSAQQDGDASASIAGYLISPDGGIETGPTSSVNNSLASQAYNAAFTLGPVLINGTEISQVSSVSIRPGAMVETRRFLGGWLPTWASIKQFNPVIEITTHNLDYLYTFGPSAVAGSSTAAYFRKRADGGTFVAGAGTVHPKFSFAGGLVTIGNARASESEPGAIVIPIYGKVLSLAVNAALP